MITVIFGGSGSGKSAFAENYISERSQGCKKYYLATMQVFDQEGRARIERHRRQRSGKGFITIEQPVAVHEVLEKMALLEREETDAIPRQRASESAAVPHGRSALKESAAEQLNGGGFLAPERTALLECMSNLAANEMFSGKTPLSGGQTADKIVRDVETLSRGVKHLVLVTNNVFEDGVAYDDSTMEYIRGLGSINERLAAMADTVIEVVAGIPLPVRGGV